MPSNSAWELISEPSPVYGSPPTRPSSPGAASLVSRACSGAITRRIGQLEGARERVVALVVGGHRHDRARAVLHQHVVGDVHRYLLAVDGVGDGPPERHARLGLLGVAAFLVGLGERVVDVLAHRLLVLGPAGESHHVGVLGRHHEERRAEQRVRAGGEHGVVDVELLAAEAHLGALAAPDPVALHGLDVLGPLDLRRGRPAAARRSR